MKANPTHYIGLGFLFLFAGLESAREAVNPAVSAFTMTAGVLFTLRGLRLKSGGEAALKGDERTRKIGAWAATYSWFATLMAVSLAYWLDYLKVIQLRLGDALGFVILFMPATMMAFRWILARKGDVQ